MEEDIKNIERIIDYIQLESPIVQGLGNAIYTDSLKRLIKGYRELEKENDSKEKAYNDCYCEFKHYKQYESIPKSKVKETMEQLDYRCNSNLERVHKKEILQELMEE